ncbi:TrmH family RNA methyltransferase [Solidesulfovibrio magneticus]|uniref:TrmH family RNA methyltransferase n=1 Tax=Solidesulfovibrio magneticus TaxID=184917 RepID=UPI0002F0C9E8|nr:RNA methyltransferase [Solidesulfovibrio magneticus]
MIKNETSRRPSTDRRSFADVLSTPSGERGQRRSAALAGSKGGSGRPSGPRPAGRPGQGGQSGQGRPRRDDDRSGSGGQGRPRRDDDRSQGGQGRPRRNDDRPGQGGQGGQGRPRRDDDRSQGGQGRPRRDDDRSGRPSGPRGQGRPPRSDDRRSGQDRPQGPGKPRFDRDDDRRPPRQDRFENDRRPPRPERFEDDRPAPRSVAPTAPVELPEDILPGRKPVRELVEQSPKSVDDVLLRQGLRGADVDAIVRACEAAGVRYRFMPGLDMDRLYPGNHQGVMARLAAGPLVSLEDVLAAGLDAPLQVILVLDRVQDPGNVGALVRTLYALGGGGILVPKHEGARLGPGAAKASAGTLARLPLAKVTNLSQALDAAKEAGYTVIGAAGEEEAQNVHLAKPPFPLALVLGSEEEGIRPGIRKRCDALWRIPQARPIDSLNVAQAGAIMMGRMAAFLGMGEG